jgi:hypothetical protein
MRDRKYIMYYRMTFDVFQTLMLELIPYLQSRCLNLVRPHLEIKKMIAIIFYKFGNGHNATHVADCFNVGASIIWKYVDIVCDVLTNINKFFSKYISNPRRNQFRLMNQEFQELTSLPNICGLFDKTHIPLVEIFQVRSHTCSK